MSEYYNLDAIRTAGQKELSIYEAYLKAWQDVTFNTKKDGSPFKTISKNINGAKYSVVDYAMQPGEYELTVYTHCNMAGYVHDSIKAYCYVKDILNEDMKAKTQNYQVKQNLLEQIYTFDIDDIKNAIAAHIEWLTEYVEDLKKQLVKLDRVFRSFRDAYASAMKTLENETSEFSHKFIYYAVRDCVKNRYPYC